MIALLLRWTSFGTACNVTGESNCPGRWDKITEGEVIYPEVFFGINGLHKIQRKSRAELAKLRIAKTRMAAKIATDS